MYEGSSGAGDCLSSLLTWVLVEISVPCMWASLFGCLQYGSSLPQLSKTQTEGSAWACDLQGDAQPACTMLPHRGPGVKHACVWHRELPQVPLSYRPGE